MPVQLHSKYAKANDGVNLVTFEDDQFPFSYGVLAVAAKTLKIDAITQVAQIIDADIVVNPDFVNDIKYNLGVGYNNNNAGYFDIQSVITHEIGHILGLLHSGVVNSTMFFTLVRELQSELSSRMINRGQVTGIRNSLGITVPMVRYQATLNMAMTVSLLQALLYTLLIPVPRIRCMHTVMQRAIIWFLVSFPDHIIFL